MHILIELGQSAKPLWDLVPVVVGAIIGAVAGAVPSYLLANKSARDLKARDEAERVRLNKAAARSAAFKLQRIVNSLATINSQLDDMLTEVEQAGIPTADLWKQFPPISGIAPELVRFDTPELALAYEAGEARLANEMILIAERHYAADLSVFEYSSRRRAFTDRAVICAADGLTEEQIIAQCGPLVVELSSAAPQIRDIYRRDQPVAIEILKRYTESMQRLFSAPEFLKVEIVEQEST